MYVGNAMLLILNLPLIGLWVQILRIPYSMLFPGILLFGLIGVYMVNMSLAEVWIMIFFGLVGYVMKKDGLRVRSAGPGHGHLRPSSRMPFANL